MKSSIKDRKFRNDVFKEAEKMLKELDCFAWSLDRCESHFKTFCSYGVICSVTRIGTYEPGDSETLMFSFVEIDHEKVKKAEEFLSKVRRLVDDVKNNVPSEAPATSVA